MKKILSLLFVAVFVFGVIFCTPATFAQKDGVKFALASDIHMDIQRETLPVNYPESELYFHGGGSGNLYDECVGLFNTFLKQAAEENVDFVLIPGDMTRSGSEAQHRQCAAILEKFEKETGIPAYIVPGNHDFYNSTREQFREYYKDVCYKNALVLDDETASYTANLPNGFRLIAVDSNNPGKDGDGMDERLYNWIDEQVKAAHADGREIIYTMHHTLLEHIVLGKIVIKDFIVRNSDEVAEKFCEWGIQYTFTGHEHGNDIAKFVGKNGNTVYDILTTALTSYPLDYRIMEFSKQGVTSQIKNIDKCDFSSLIKGYNEKQLELMRTDYDAYAYGMFTYSIRQKILQYTSPDFIKKKLKMADADNPLTREIDALMNLVVYTLDMPLYDTGDGVSIESLAAQKGVTLPKSEYLTLADFISCVAALHYHGDENRPYGEYPECELFVKALNTGLEYILSNADKEAVNALLSHSDELAGDYSDELRAWVTAASRGENSYERAGAILYPLLEKILVDKGPADRTVTMPPVGENVNKQAQIMTFTEKLVAILKYVLNIVITFIK